MQDSICINMLYFPGARTLTDWVLESICASFLQANDPRLPPFAGIAAACTMSSFPQTSRWMYSSKTTTQNIHERPVSTAAFADCLH